MPAAPLPGRQVRDGVLNFWRLEVEWDDSTLLASSWEKIPALLKRRKATRIHSAGFVLADDEKGVVLAASVHGDEAAGVTMIPASAVRRKRRVR